MAFAVAHRSSCRNLLALQDLLMTHLGLGAAERLDAIDAAHSKAALDEVVNKILGALDASKKPAAANALREEGVCHFPDV